MWNAGGVASRTKRWVLRRHVRSHFGRHAFEPKCKVMLLCEEHTEVFISTVPHHHVALTGIVARRHVVWGLENPVGKTCWRHVGDMLYDMSSKRSLMSFSKSLYVVSCVVLQHVGNDLLVNLNN